METSPLDAIINVFKEVYTNPKTLSKSLGIIVFNINCFGHFYNLSNSFYV